MLTADRLEGFVRRTTAELRACSPPQRDAFIEKLLRSDPELAGVLPALLGTYAQAKARRRLGPLRRDSIGAQER